MKTKPINIFEFYAPTGGGSKIADAMNVISDAKKVNSNSATSNSGNPTISSSVAQPQPKYESASNTAGEINSTSEASNGKTNNLVWWILGGVIVGGSLWLWYRDLQKKKKEEEFKNKIKSDKMRNKKSDTTIDEYINKRG